MPLDEHLKKEIIEAAAGTADAGRAERNLIRLFETGNEALGRLSSYIPQTADLFAASQFLANFCVAFPEELEMAYAELHIPLGSELLSSRATEEFALKEEMDQREFMRRLRLYKKRYLLRITLRDLRKTIGITDAMDELTTLAEEILEFTLDFCFSSNIKRFGSPPGGEPMMSIIALGKLGGAEINYSSDVDIIAVYADMQGETSGVQGPTGVTMGRISVHEFYCKVVEQLNKVLSTVTDEGIGYRVDLRLRPQGQKGDIAMPLSAYRAYYESWGRTWERMTLIRARHVAGDTSLGEAFFQVIDPFVWRRTVDYSDIEEIRALKKKIDSTFTRDDIKRGHGGIREAEFFVNTFQLLYGGEHRGLRTHRLLDAIEAIGSMGIVPREDLRDLADSYLYLRRVEHLLQMRDDLQTYTLPSGQVEREALGRLMGFPSGGVFLSDTRVKRMKIKNMYNSLLGTREDINAEALTLLESDLSEAELHGYLNFRRVLNPDACLGTLKRIRQQFEVPRTQGERTAMRRVIPGLLEMALEAESPDRALSGLEDFFEKHGISEAYLTALTEEKALTKGIIKVFSLSPFLTRLFLSRKRYLNVLVEEMPIRKSLRRVREELGREVKRGKPGGSALQGRLMRYKAVEWLRLGMFFLSGVLTAYDLQRYLSHLADALVGAAVTEADAEGGFAVVALGKHGGRELTYESDLDLIFVAETPEGLITAERVFKTLTAYTDRGILYDVDMRLRPDGTKGSLVKDLEGYRRYYLEKAGNWEVQALTKARFIAGDRVFGDRFICMAHEVLGTRGGDITWGDIRSMRERIVAEHGKKPGGRDIKTGPGGMEDVEFFVQWMQLQAASQGRLGVLVQDTQAALARMAHREMIMAEAYKALKEAYAYHTRLKTFLRLNEEKTLALEGEAARLVPEFMGHKGSHADSEFLKQLEHHLDAVRRFAHPQG